MTMLPAAERQARALTTAPSSQRALDHPVGPTHPMVTTAERQARVLTTGQLPFGPTR